MKKFDLIMRRVMLLPVVLVTSTFSPIAAVIWYICYILDSETNHNLKGVTKRINPSFVSILVNGTVLIGVEMLHKRYWILKLNKARR